MSVLHAPLLAVSSFSSSEDSASNPPRHLARMGPKTKLWGLGFRVLGFRFKSFFL